VTSPFTASIKSSEVTTSADVTHTAASGYSIYCTMVVYSASVAGAALTASSTPAAYDPPTKKLTIVSTQALVGTSIVIDIKAED
jgi:hypothetical protein